MKYCPICHAVCFDDMEVCYGCMHRFDEYAHLAQAGLATGRIAAVPAFQGGADWTQETLAAKREGRHSPKESRGLMLPAIQLENQRPEEGRAGESLPRQSVPIEGEGGSDGGLAQKAPTDRGVTGAPAPPAQAIAVEASFHPRHAAPSKPPAIHGHVDQEDAMQFEYQLVISLKPANPLEAPSSASGRSREPIRG